jgi:hypothetical protein
MMENQLYNLNLFADYFQFYVCDGFFKTDTSTLWDETTTDQMLAVGPDVIAVGTVRNMHVPLTLEILGGEPAKDFSEWDQVIECAVTFPSGTVIAFGCTEDPETAERFQVKSGAYAARISYGNLRDLSDNGLEGDDRYRVQLWRGEAGQVTVVKRRPD